jgi:CheY-like chemotaxis protein
MKPPHILLVDDDLAMGALLRDHLVNEGFNVTLAGNCAEGRRVLQGSKPVDAMILDQFLPDGLGIDMLRAMTPEDGLQKPPVIVSSSWIRPDDPGWTQILERLPPVSKSLVQAFVPKPYLLESMDTMLDLVISQGHTPASGKVINSGDYPKKA